ncbi:MAG TPA: radical SAM protein [Pyrinomonadaceae bacterium]|jgi:radical SAM protein with 4Fe4S-binding SPASM domain
MMKNHLSVIFLPTNKCNVECTYCFEDKTDDRMTHEQLSAVISKLLDFMETDDIGSLTLHWQGGELMTLPVSWFETAYDIIGNLAQTRGKTIDHGMQTNMIAYTPRWDPIIKKMFGGSVGTSMDYPNHYRRLKNGSAEEYTRIWRQNVKTARENGIGVGVISVLNQATLEIGAERFYSFFVDELGIKSFQVNTPFPGGETNETKQNLALENEVLSRFFIDLTDIWLERGYRNGVSLNPIDELVKHFSSEQSCLPCIWQTNCADEFISIDARGFVAQCDCWVTSYPEYFFGNIFEHESLAELLRTSPARAEFIARPMAIIDQGCIECDYLSICHGGCPVRTYTKKQKLNEKDPYCSLYKALFRHTERVAAQLAERRFMAQTPKNNIFESARQKVLYQIMR